tara:strand:- start:1003 stop:1713 length:711 start_codon:yes stop_codon:yes gene_type:complete
MKQVRIYNKKIYPFASTNDLLKYADTQKKALIAINAEKVMNPDLKLAEFINSNIGYADGAGAVLALKKLGLSKSVKIAGVDLWLYIISKKHLTQSFYFIGGTQDVIDKVIDRVSKKFKEIKIKGVSNGYFNEDKEEEIISDIRRKKPDYVFVAIGSPKQEMFIKKAQKHHSAIYLGLGGSFDVYSESVKRAPSWMVNNNLEFLYRLIKQPRRVFRQVILLKFILLLYTKKDFVSEM